MRGWKAIHVHHQICIEYTASLQHSGQTACQKVNQGLTPLFKLVCQETPLMYQFTRAQISEWLHNTKLVPDHSDTQRIVHACKKWAETKTRRGLCKSWPVVSEGLSVCLSTMTFLSCTDFVEASSCAYQFACRGYLGRWVRGGGGKVRQHGFFLLESPFYL